MLKEKFLKLIARYSKKTTFNTNCWQEIQDQYSSASRHYHNLTHLQNMVEELEEVHSMVKEIDNILFSIYYHDIIYNSTKTDNEYKSALLFKERISNTNFKNIDICFAQIEATKTHIKSNDLDTNILLDLDLTILGKDKNEYDEYCQNIRKEYSIYPDFLYRKGRKKVLNKMLQKESIYKTEYFINKYEAIARTNIREELNQLIQ